jgi:hypothetical protein
VPALDRSFGAICKKAIGIRDFSPPDLKGPATSLMALKLLICTRIHTPEAQLRAL